VKGIGFSATAATFRGTSPNNTVVVTVEANASDLGLIPKDGKLTGNLGVAIAVVDRYGKLRASVTPTLALGLRPETYNQVAQRGSIRIVSQFALPPGRYQVRAAAFSAGAKNGGGVQYDLDVPDFTKPRFSLSSVALASSWASLSLTAADAHLNGKLPEPTTQRTFSPDEELTLYVEAYDNQPTPAHKVAVTSTVRADDGRVVFEKEQRFSNEDLHNEPGLSTHIPLKGLGPRLYVLTVEARSELGNMEPVEQLLQFRIR
jgi:hypothetical protein